MEARAGAGGDAGGWAGGPLALTNVTLGGNSASNGAGGGLLATYGTATLVNVTFSGNTATGNGGGIFFYAIGAADSLTLTNTLLADSGTGGNCYVSPDSLKALASAGFNLSDDHSCESYFTQGGDQNNQPAGLLPLANNGGFTLTHLPRHTSLAVDQGPALGCPATDQRGQPRPAGAACDIGAVEVQATDRAWVLDLPALWR